MSLASQPTTLGAVLPGLEGEAAAVPLRGLAFDSRRVRPGDVFVAVPGARADGLGFARAAAAAGAAAIVAERAPAEPLDAPVAVVPDARLALSSLAAALHPRQPETILAVTGTSGKTSVAEFTRQILAALGRDAASLGTLGLVRGDGAAYGSLTTPDPVTLHQTLDDLAGAGLTHLAMEASSHGLDQRRLDGVRLSAAGFTNLGRDHLDYHPTIEAYLAAKLALFTRVLPAGGTAVVNRDGDRSEDVARACAERGVRTLTVGRAGRDLRLADAPARGFDRTLVIDAFGRRVETSLRLAGGFQVENALVAAGLAIAGGEDVERTLAALAELRGAPGRLERVGPADGEGAAAVFVDYAHKPEALAAVLDTLRAELAPGGRLVCVFGCGGDRDRGKRPLMGAIAAAKADFVIVTDDNPRTEEPAAIRAEILAAAPGAVEIGDRREAIRAGVAALRPGDALVVAGKGHETGQIVGDRTLPFSDHAELAAALREARSS